MKIHRGFAITQIFADPGALIIYNLIQIAYPAATSIGAYNGMRLKAERVNLDSQLRDS